MLFNSHLFLGGFLPPALAFYAVVYRHETARIWYLIAISLVFYAWWNPPFVLLLIGSVIVNWLAAAAFFSTGRRSILVAAIAGDLACLGFFKYTNFLLGTADWIGGFTISPLDIFLPLGISFFTFHHIIYLADCIRGRARLYSFRDYALYIVLFPQILAGPIVRHNEIVPQFSRTPWTENVAETFARALVLVVIGLAKKVLIADSLAHIAAPVFDKAAQGSASLLAGGDAWLGILAFTFQIYFDFSGYSDIAIGLASIFGFTLPFNFDAPYRSLNVREFWRRWHMTLSRFLRDYVYIPLGGNRHGLPIQVYALMATMLLGGLWHGAGWTFVTWGGLHGVALVIVVLWQRQGFHMPAWGAWPVTFLFLIVTWVFFRATSFMGAAEMLRAMAGWGYGGWRFPVTMLNPWHSWIIGFAAALAIFGPTSQEVALVRLTPRRITAIATALAAVFVLMEIGDRGTQEFIYFHF